MGAALTRRHKVRRMGSWSCQYMLCSIPAFTCAAAAGQKQQTHHLLLISQNRRLVCIN